MAIPFLSLLVQTLVYTTLALLLSMFLPSRSLAATITGMVVATSYIVSSLAFMDEHLDALAKFMPYHYFQTVLSFQELNVGWLFPLLGFYVPMMLVAWLRFVRRDIRLSGEAAGGCRSCPGGRNLHRHL